MAQQILRGTPDEIARQLRKTLSSNRRYTVAIMSAEECNEEAVEHEPTLLRQAISRMTNRTPEQLAQAQAHAMETYLPRRSPPPGKTLADVISGQWPGEETDEQIEVALRELS